ncbi:Up-regulated during septation-domain-containing protein [Radiomyces spectabilis]|uniref:Up-regulated during septation-domain-containing protein n=1 Tax=Radiomyces spectabilis TaxID=64574 RepID=UPI00221FF887|nr:Up-regulated during septation-domain-containing protein [Radiomyces spectabilis]KAI8390872.1 Up-regulated during septation-domain-containing protein [Radiomyces spectabilis]
MNMIPLARQSSDDDRPAGLKLARNQGNMAQGSLFARDMFGRRPSAATTSTPTDQKPKMSFDSDTSGSRNLFQARTSIDSHSPSVPARSPFRIRDSQASLSRKKSTTDSIASHTSHHKLSNAGPLDSAYHSHSTKHAPSIHTDTIQKNETDDLTAELVHLWKVNPPPTLDAGVSTKLPTVTESTDDLLIQLLVSQAMLDAHTFDILSFDEVEKIKKQYHAVQERLSVLRPRIALETRIKDISKSLLHLNVSSRDSIIALEDQAQAAEKKRHGLTAEFEKLTDQAYHLQCKLLRHTAGALNRGLKRIEERMAMMKPTDDASQVNIDLERQVTEIQDLVASKNNQLQKLQDQMDVDHRRGHAGSHTDMNEWFSKLDTILHQHQTETDANRPSSTNQNEKDRSATLVDSIDHQFQTYKSKIAELERQVVTLQERYQVESASDKRLEIQLRAMEEKKNAVELRYQALLDKSQRRSLDESDIVGLGIGRSARDSHHVDQTVERLEKKVANAEQELKSREKEFEAQKEELFNLKSRLTDLEVRNSKLESQASISASREKALQMELKQYKDEVFTLRTEKERGERQFKRESVLQMLDGHDSVKIQYEQQMEEQAQEYEAQLKEQQALLEKTMRRCEQLEVEHEKSTMICKDLEDLVKDKSRMLDRRDVHITKLESELQELRHRPHKPDQALVQLQAAFTAREEDWIAQNAKMEANFEGILKEFDRLTGTAMTFETSRMKYERRIEQLMQEKQQMDKELIEARINKLGYVTTDTPTTASLRKEFRALMNDIKLEHQRSLEKEYEEQRRLEKLLKDIQHDKEVSNYQRMNKGVQTNFIVV